MDFRPARASAAPASASGAVGPGWQSAPADVVTEVTQQNGTDTETYSQTCEVGRIASPPSHRHRARACGGWTSLPLSLSSRGCPGAA